MSRCLNVSKKIAFGLLSVLLFAVVDLHPFGLNFALFKLQFLAFLIMGYVLTLVTQKSYKIYEINTQHAIFFLFFLAAGILISIFELRWSINRFGSYILFFLSLIFFLRFKLTQTLSYILFLSSSFVCLQWVVNYFSGNYVDFFEILGIGSQKVYPGGSFTGRYSGFFAEPGDAAIFAAIIAFIRYSDPTQKLDFLFYLTFTSICLNKSILGYILLSIIVIYLLLSRFRLSRRRFFEFLPVIGALVLGASVAADIIMVRFYDIDVSIVGRQKLFASLLDIDFYELLFGRCFFCGIDYDWAIVAHNGLGNLVFGFRYFGLFGLGFLVFWAVRFLREKSVTRFRLVLFLILISISKFPVFGVVCAFFFAALISNKPRGFHV